MSTSQTHALVIGGSMAGLMAARVLGDYFQQVTVVERDRFPAAPEFRQGVPQAHHVHVLLKRGEDIVEQYFPGIEAELEQAGAQAVDFIADYLFFSYGSWKPRFPSNLVLRTCSRDLLEWTIRRRLMRQPKIRWIEEADVVGLVAADGKTRVTGVQLRHRHPTGTVGNEEKISADLVVDASGRDAHASRWLAALGYRSVPETTVNSFLGYATRWYRRPPDLQADWKALAMQALPPASSRGGVIFPIEGNRWIVTLAGAARDYPPTDEPAFMEFARSLPRPLLYEAIKMAEPLTPIYGYRRTENQLRHYDRMTRFPENFILVGDAVCAFNPVYGQGMSAAAQGVRLLDQILSKHRTKGDFSGMAHRFQRELAQVNSPLWLLATGEDFRYPTTEGGRRGLLTRLAHLYVERVQLAANENRQVLLTFVEVANLLRPPGALFRPDILIPVLTYKPKRQAVK